MEELVYQVEQTQSSSLKNGTSDPVWKETTPILSTVFRGKLLISAFLPSEISCWFGGLSHIGCFIICMKASLLALLQSPLALQVAVLPFPTPPSFLLFSN